MKIWCLVRSFGLGLVLSLFALPGIAAWNGVVDWSQRTELSTTLTGMVTHVPVKRGDRVKKGQLLLQLEQGAIKARLSQRQAEMKHRELMRAEAGKELERAEELYARTLLADHDLDVAKIAYAEADAAYQAGRAEYLQAKEDLDNSTLSAPFDGVVLARHIQPGQAVISRCEAKSLLTLASSTQLQIRIFVEADKVEGLRHQDSVTVEVAGERYKGKVEGIGLGPETAKESARYPVDVQFSTDNLMLVGQSATVSLP